MPLSLLRGRQFRHADAAAIFLRGAYTKSRAARDPKRPPPPPPTPTPPKPREKPVPFTFHGATWQDPYSWMSEVADKVAMRQMDVYMEQEEKHLEAVISDSERLQNKLQSEIAGRLPCYLSSPPPSGPLGPLEG